jgi:serine/threonine-protein kinase
MCGRCGTALPLAPGTLLDERYEILGHVGRGGMGSVYRAHDRTLHEPVALKILRADIAASPEMGRRFISEIRLARRVGHRNVCRIFEYGQDGPLRFIVMEYIEGEDLRRVIQRHGPLLPEEALGTLLQVAAGLEAIHELGVVHRDLKTANLMRDARGVVKLMDFGIAKEWGAETATHATATGMAVGTPEYMSPEQAQGEKVDFRSDIYSLGIVAFELFTGELPFRGTTPMATALKQIQEPPPLEGPRAARIPPPVIPILRCSLAKRPAERYESVADVSQALLAARGASGTGFGGATGAEASLGPVPASGRESPPPRPAIASTPPRPATPPPLPGTRAPATPPRSSPVPGALSSPRSATPPGMLPRARTAGRDSAAPEIGRRVSRRLPVPLVLALVALGILGFVVVVVGGYLLLRGFGGRTPAATSQVARSQTPVRGDPSPPPPTTATAQATATVPTPAPPPRSERPARGHTGDGTARRASAQDTPATRATTPARRAVAPTRVVKQGEPGPKSTEPGTLKLLILPWAKVSIDGKDVGTTPLAPVSLSPGRHTVRMTHPGFRPLTRRVEIRSGRTTRLEVNMKDEAFPLPAKE